MAWYDHLIKDPPPLMEPWSQWQLDLAKREVIRVYRFLRKQGLTPHLAILGVIADQSSNYMNGSKGRRDLLASLCLEEILRRSIEPGKHGGEPHSAFWVDGQLSEQRQARVLARGGYLNT